MIQISSYKKTYDQHVILEIESLKLEKGIHWVLGKNGSGKSTLFKSIMGIVPFEGEIVVEGKACNSIASKRILGFSEAEPQYPAAVSGRDILQFVAEVKNTNTDFLNETVKNWGVDIYWKNAISTYSSGMLKKISLLSAFLGTPQWIILDEPFILIDTHTVSLLQGLIVDFVEKHDTSFIISSHQIFEIQTEKAVKSYLIENCKIVEL
jgi:ABC-2 type transport system ATP-binding protein